MQGVYRVSRLKVRHCVHSLLCRYNTAVMAEKTVRDVKKVGHPTN